MASGNCNGDVYTAGRVTKLPNNYQSSVANDLDQGSFWAGSDRIVTG